MWKDVQVIQELIGFCQTMFPVAKYATSYTPTFPLGQLGYVICGLDHVSWSEVGVGVKWELE